MHTDANIHACATLSIIYYYKTYSYNNISVCLEDEKRKTIGAKNKKLENTLITYVDKPTHRVG